MLMGLIPARAGKTGQPVADLIISMAHPRAGGENWTADAKPSHSGGSSPRGRGKPCGWVQVGPGVGLIPARAGKTPKPCRVYTRVSAHPRAGGENIHG